MSNQLQLEVSLKITDLPIGDTKVFLDELKISLYK
jgi:hypothetical protein